MARIHSAIILAALPLLLGLAGCVVATPEPRPVVVERQQPVVVVRP
jgi:hypothetical protein